MDLDYLTTAQPPSLQSIHAFFAASEMRQAIHYFIGGARTQVFHPGNQGKSSPKTSSSEKGSGFVFGFSDDNNPIP